MMLHIRNITIKSFIVQLPVIGIKKIFNEYDWGAHSFSHANMGLETDSFFINDLKLCRRWFKKNLDISPYIYAFPNGSYKKHQLLLARNEGFSTILLVNNKFSCIKKRIHSRFGFHAYRNSEMRFRAVGSFAKTRQNLFNQT